MKVLFLDIDGVLNSTRSCAAFDGYPLGITEEDLKKFDWVAVKLIQRLCDETGARIVLSSTWRLTVPFKDLAKALDLPIIDKTPVAFGRGRRGYEVSMWLAEHEEVVDKYAIVDDLDEFVEEQQEFFVQTDPSIGLSYLNFLKLKLELGKE
jgi:hypothetical protein